MTIEQVAEIEAIAAEQEEFNEVTQQPESETKTADILFPVLSVAFGFIAPNWQMQNDEVMQLSRAYGALIDKHYKSNAGKYSVEFAAVIITGEVFISRIGVPRKVAKEADETGIEGELNGD